MNWQEIVKKYDLDVSVVNFDELMVRIDAEYYKPKYLIGNEQLILKKAKKLSEIAAIKGGKRLPKGENFCDEGIPYIRAEDVKNSFVEYENSPKISLGLHQKLKAYQTKHNDVLLTIVGNSIGDVGLVKFSLEKCNLTENCAKIVNLKEITPEFLFVFLLSKYGQIQIEREKVGTSQPKLALVRIKDFMIPMPKKLHKEVVYFVKEAKNSKDESVLLFRKAEQLLLSELGISDYIQNEANTSIRDLFECLQDDRFDAEYWMPKYDEIIKLLTRNSVSLKEICTVIKGSSIKYKEEGKNEVIKTKQLKNSYIDIDSIEDKTNEGFILQDKDLLFASMGVGSLGKLDIFYEEIYKSHYVTDSTLFTIRNCSIKPEALMTLLRTKIYQELIYRYIVGSSGIISISKTHFENLPIPKIDIEIQCKIAELVKTSLTQRQHSKHLLEKAKQAVEIFIEQDEAQALAYLAS